MVNLLVGGAFQEERGNNSHMHNNRYLQAGLVCCVHHCSIHGILTASVPLVISKHASINFPGQNERRGMFLTICRLQLPDIILLITCHESLQPKYYHTLKS